MGIGTHKELLKEQSNSNGKCVLCQCENAGLQHIWWECEACNSVSNLGWTQLKAIRRHMNAEPQCLWTAGNVYGQLGS
eukprot:14186463-Heterocapsa_arctica.AAC.1